ncbi:MAG: hypothetical protein IPP74_09725 [Alphaproteobacteria bacterium]|nr:hypothetical protein [Alphaproteobacteria bacterium]
MLKTKWKIYRDRQKQFRWRCQDTKGNVLGNSFKGFKNENECRKNALMFGYRASKK